MLSLLASLLCSTASAQEGPPTPFDPEDFVLNPQFTLSVDGSRAVTDAVSFRGSVIGLWDPGAAGEDDLALGFLYLGPKVEVAKWFSTAPQVGTVANWTGEGDLRVLFSSWNWLSVGSVRAFLEGDVYIDPMGGAANYYGFYSIDYASDYADIGPQVEHVDNAFGAGVHVGIPLGDHLYLQLAYFRSIEEEPTNNIRTGLFLTP